MTDFKKRTFKRKGAHRDSSLIVIAAEGAVTEVQYFENFVTKEHFYSSRVRVEVVKRDDPTHSSPLHVLESLDKIITDFELNDGDELWLLIDKDRWTPAQFAEVSTKCNAKNINMSVSNPCFELWLLLHFREISSQLDLFNTSDKITAELKSILGSYNKTIKFEKFKDYVYSAISNSKIIDSNPADRWPQKTGTHVYKLAESILKFHSKDNE